ncbi:MAG TPA: UDP-glucuronic acid decarboxylase family protein [Acidobacteriota bacterium]|nr:UDP-glucuronic acid decarboxylase family protein [Acidobacteriota bacterium]
MKFFRGGIEATMRIVITGGAGFLGSHLCGHLLKLGNEVICLDNLSTGSIGNISRFMGNDRFQFYKHDVTEYIFISQQVDAVLHFASPASPRDYLELPIQTLKVGALGTHKALGLAKKEKARFLMASTSETYGDPLVNPQPESYWGNVNPIGYRGVYDEAKRFAEAMVMAYHRYHGVDTRIARIFNTYGPRMRPHDGRVISNFIVQALQGDPLTVYGAGDQTRSFCYVDDQIDGLVRLLMAPDNEEIHLPFNIGNPQELTVLEIAKKIIELSGSSSKIIHDPLPEDDPKVRRPDITRAGRLLDWNPQISLDEGLRRTIDFFRTQLALTG